MATGDENMPATADAEPPMLRSSQPLGFLPSREFWRDPENARLAVLPLSISVFVLIVVISALLDPAWWIAFLLFPTTMVLAQGLLERYVRREVQRRAL